jgi:thiamine pyrophosphokinase
MGEKAACYIFGAGEHYGAPPGFPPGSFVIAADGGLAYLDRHGVSPDIIVGDFDSLPGFAPDGFPAAGVVSLPREKDDTDMAAALKEGGRRGFRVFHIYGGTGGRLDHTLANIQCIAELAGRGGRGYLYGEDIVVTAIRDGTLDLPAGIRGIVSVFCHSDSAYGVCERGLKYSLTDAALRSTYPLGVSNELTGEPARISVRSGTLIVIYPRSSV